MRRIILICACIFVAISCSAQENDSVKKALKNKYGITNVKEINEKGYEGWYEVCTDLSFYTRGVFDNKGNIIIPISEHIHWFDYQKDCIIIIKNANRDDGSWKDKILGIYSKNGTLLLQCEYTYIKTYNDDNIYLIGKGGNNNEAPMGYSDYPKNAKFALFNVKEGKFITQFIYDYIEWMDTKEKLARFNIGGEIVESGKDVVVKGGKWGYLDESGKEIIPAKYASASRFHDRVAQVTRKGVASLISNPLSENMIYTRTEQAVALDTQIPETKQNNDESFAFILSNENYTNLSGADYSINDGKIFAEYCKKTLGLAENNVRYYEDATYGNILKVIKQIQDIADVYDGEAKILFYFSGLGMSDDKDGKKYLLPSDASLSALSSTALALNDLLGNLNKLNTKCTMVLVDAPFNGTDKNGKALETGRGVKIKNRNDEEVSGNMVLLIGNEGGNNYSSKNLGHGLLTYSLLNHLKQTKGNSSVGSLLETAITNTKKESLDKFKEVQKPLIKVSEQIKDKLQTLKL